MARLPCDFFPNTPAIWACVECSTHFGARCIPGRDQPHWGRRKPVCVRCDGPLDYLGRATDAKPFWQRLPHFFLCAMHPNALFVVLLVTAMSLGFTAGLLTVFLALLAAAVVTKYGIAMLEQQSKGGREVPSVIDVLSGDEHHLFLRQVAVIFVLAAVVVVGCRLNLWLGLAAALLVTLITPASLILLAVEKSVRAALDPFALLGLVARVGWPYLLLWFIVQLVSAAPYLALQFWIDALATQAVLPATIALATYVSFVLYAMLGYVVFQYQYELGYDYRDEGADALSRDEFDKALALGEVTVHLRDGRLDRARECLRRALDTLRDDPDLHQQYHKILMRLGDDQSLANHGDYFIGLLRRCNTLHRAIPVLLDVQSRLPQFRLTDTRTALDLARMLCQQGHYNAVIRLFRGLHETRDDDPLLPEAYLLVATVLVEQFNDDEQAQDLIQWVLQNHPDCAELSEMHRLLRLIATGSFAAQTG